MEERESNPLFADWCIMELMGHRRLAGFVREVELAGKGLLRIDIPSTPPVTQFYGGAAIYCLTPTTEAIARGLAAQVHAEPVSRYELPPARVPSPMCYECGRDIDPGETVIYLLDGRFRCTECQENLGETTEGPSVAGTTGQ
jgi:hypothetical protein